MDTLLINLFGGPGVGKSTLMASVFAELKKRGKHVEMAHEFAKDLVWSKSTAVFNHPFYVHAEQLYRIARLDGEVEFIITDSPTLLSLVYAPNSSPEFAAFVLSEHEKAHSFDLLVQRTVPFTPVGRNEANLEEAELVDDTLIATLAKYGITYMPVTVDDTELIVNAALFAQSTLRGPKVVIRNFTGLL